MGIPYCTVNKTIKIAKEYGKIWETLELKAEDILTLAKGGQIVNNFSQEYDPSNYKNDYFLCKIEQKTAKDGKLVFPGEQFNSVRVNVAGISDFLPYIAKSLTSAIIEAGFDHNYYKSLVLYAGCTQPTGNAGYVLHGSVDGNNIIYIQDVSQQEFEYNIDEDKDSKVIKREELHATTFGEAFVVSIKGKNAANSTAFAFVIGKSQLAYVDTTTNSIKWANTDLGGVYPVTFDNASLRWVVQTEQRTIEGETYTYAEPMTDGAIAALLNTGLEFEAAKYTAEAVIDDSMKLTAKCLGIGDKYLGNLFSFNGAFETGSTNYLEYIGRPIGYNFDTYTWYSEEWDEEAQEWVKVKHIERNGSHTWTSDVDGVPISLIIPDNCDEEGKTHRNQYIVQMDTSSLLSTETLYRHSFKITSNSEATWQTGDWKISCAFQGTNTQMGDDTLDYILFSDESKQNDSPDWILPCQGKVGQVDNNGQVTAWHDILRIKATYTDNTCATRCLRFEYFDNDMAIQNADVITSENFGKYIGRDFRSEICNVKTPQRLKSDVVEVSLG